MKTELNRTKANPWKLKTPPGTSEFTMHLDPQDDRQSLVCTVGKTVLHSGATNYTYRFYRARQVPAP